LTCSANFRKCWETWNQWEHDDDAKLQDNFAVVHVFVVLVGGIFADGADCGLWVVETLKQWAAFNGCCVSILAWSKACVLWFEHVQLWISCDSLAWLLLPCAWSKACVLWFEHVQLWISCDSLAWLLLPCARSKACMLWFEHVQLGFSCGSLAWL